MSTHQRAINFGSAPDAVVAWRAERLSEAGLPRALARTIATDGDYDVHAVLELVDRGCPAQLAVRILAPC